MLMVYVLIFLSTVTLNPQGRPHKHYDRKHQPPALSVKSADHHSKLDLPSQGIVGSMSGGVASPIRWIKNICEAHNSCSKARLEPGPGKHVLC